VAADPSDLIQAVHHRQGRGQDLTGFGVDGAGRRPGRLAGCLDRRGGAATRVGGWGLRGGDRGDRLLDPAGELVDLAAEASIWSSSILASSA
jgi:hypothetical protein